MRFYEVIKGTFCIVLSIILAGCASVDYTPPKGLNNPEQKYSKKLDKSFDETWTSLISYAGKSFFAIDNFEKESGLMTLSFGSSNYSRFVNCGYVDAKAPSRGYKYKGSLTGLFVDNSKMDIEMDGRMNVFVEEIAPAKSRVRVNARYVLTFTQLNEQWNISFDTGGEGRHIGDEITTQCRPTYKAEKAILEAVSDS